MIRQSTILSGGRASEAIHATLLRAYVCAHNIKVRPISWDDAFKKYCLVTFPTMSEALEMDQAVDDMTGGDVDEERN